MASSSPSMTRWVNLADDGEVGMTHSNVADTVVCEQHIDLAVEVTPTEFTCHLRYLCQSFFGMKACQPPGSGRF